MKQGLTLFVLLLLAYVLFSGKLRAVIKAITGATPVRPALPPTMGSVGQGGGGVGDLLGRVIANRRAGWDL